MLPSIYNDTSILPDVSNPPVGFMRSKYAKHCYFINVYMVLKAGERLQYYTSNGAAGEHTLPGSEPCISQ